MPKTLVASCTRIAIVVAAAGAIAACEVNLNTEGLTTREKRTFPVSGQPDLTLETFDGSIEIHSWDRNEVEVEIEKRAMDQSLIDQMTVEAEQQGDRIVLRVKGPSRQEDRGVTIGVHVSPAARLLVAVPRHLTLQVRTEDGAIRVEDLAGRLSLGTGDGSVTADRVSGELEIRSGDGSIRVDNAEGKLDVETDDGTITLDAKATLLRARTGDGSIRTRIASGSVMADAWDVQTRDGSVTLTLPTGFNAEIDAETSDGSVRSSHPDLPDRNGERNEDDRRARRELRARMGEGGHPLKIRTGDGNIRIES
jgi:DUF4097 and DUF4098 domain-containing protein YvlB